MLNTVENHTITLQANTAHTMNKPGDTKLEFYLEHKYTDKYEAKQWAGKDGNILEEKISEQKNKNGTESIHLLTKSCIILQISMGRILINQKYHSHTF